MLLECHNCGAPLDVPDGASSARCNYCGNSEKVARFRTVAIKTPEGFTPPPTWTPTTGSSLPVEPLPYRPMAAARMVARWLRISAIASVALGGFIAWRVLSSVQDAATNSALSMLTQPDQVQKVVETAMSIANAVKGPAVQAAAAAARAALAGDTVPVICKGNDNVTITGKNLALPGAVPVIASNNCTIHLVACTVSGATALVAKNNATVVVEGGSLSGTGPAVLLSENATLEVSAGARLSGESTVTAANNARATVRDSSISGSHVAIHSSNNASVDATGSTVQGQVVGARVRR